ncbi:MAG TPA: hypothetical protein PKB07_06865 [Flavilitoribacter sp.]|nr:hypothetical protein [Flavilitoribacter sp.]
MKKLLIVLVAFALWQCQKDKPLDPRPVDFGQDIALAKGQSAMVSHKNPTMDLMVETTDIGESRCPSDVVCVWAGFAKADLKVSSEGETANVSLCLGQCEAKYKLTDTTYVQLGGTEFGLILKEINPFPTSTNGSDPKTAVVEVFIK